MQCVALPLNLNIIHFLEEDMQTNNEKKKRSKAAKIVLWSLVGCVAAILITMLVWVIIAATGGTGTSNGGILGLGFNMVKTALLVVVLLLIMVWMLTEPSFKKEEVIEIVEVKPQYVKKSARPQPVKKAEPKPEEPKEEEKKEEEPAEEPAPTEDEAKDEAYDDDDGADDGDDDDDVDDDAEDDDDDDDEAVAPIVADGPETVLYRYRRSFMSKMIQASDHTKDYYKDIKNKLLSYKNMRARTSWSFESFNSGRNKMAKINVRGKTLVLYLALDPAEYANTKYHIRDMSAKAKYAAVPAMVRVKSPRAAKFAIELIEQLAEKKGLVANPKYTEESFDLTTKTTEALIEEGLIKVVYNKNMDPDGNYVTEQANIGEIINK